MKYGEIGQTLCICGRGSKRHPSAGLSTWQKWHIPRDRAFFVDKPQSTRNYLFIMAVRPNIYPTFQYIQGHSINTNHCIFFNEIAVLS